MSVAMAVGMETLYAQFGLAEIIYWTEHTHTRIL